MKKVLAVTGVAALLMVGTASTATADSAYHAERIALEPISDAQLRSGSVVNIHANGPKVYALERYLLNGALPNHHYEITLNVHLFDPDCLNPAAPFFSLPISTNGAGNGHTKAPTIPPEAVAGLAGEHGVNWIVKDEQGTAVYETGCVDVVLD